MHAAGRIGCRGNGRQPSFHGGEGERDQAGDGRSRGAGHQRSRQAEDLDQEEAGDEGSQHRAEGVCRVQASEDVAKVGGPPGQVPCQARERGPHEDRRRGKCKQREREPDGAESDVVLLEHRIRPPVGAPDCREQGGRDQHDHHEQELEAGIEAEPRADAIGQPASDEIADRHPGEVARQDRGDGLGGVAEDQHQLARPDDLVGQTGSAGQHEDRDDRRLEAPHVHSLSMGSGGLYQPDTTRHPPVGTPCARACPIRRPRPPRRSGPPGRPRRRCPRSRRP